MNWRVRILLVLAAAGVAVSSYLYLKSADPGSVVCSIGGGCEVVLSSKYAKFYGFPVAGMGILWYVVTLGLIYLVFFRRVWSELPLRIWAVIGLAVSLYLLALEMFVIHYYCTWCLVSLGLVILITLTSLVKRR